ncbi:NADH-quinone oxidoreductase subunit C [Granulicella mallensis]|jgi:NADH-quinone oxidoreductase subunit C|uniref:NADH-quinone oxidoreductase subunit C n=1 Tax=Granulicella mallensis TaxID=940614 RepID=A0A7W7ZTB8_9BACT|nr:NADH-quinone oxidoreductase subunit C [Granulicella mallensis]MBB5065767.1 NADH-quinone oxidoreductase subunit C [Granulicella mallensis]
MADAITNPATPEACFGKEAVTAALADHAAIKGLADLIVDAKWDRQELTLTVAPDTIIAAAKAAQAAGYNFLEDVTAVDWYPTEPRFQISYSILSFGLKQRIRLVARIAEGQSIDSITSVWPSANFYEREVFDLFGVHFGGHPRLTRIMMPDNWEGHPLRKDYPVEGYR